MSDEKDNLTGHDYDGIQEYDNPLPDWWLFIFLATIIFAFIYWIHYEFGGAPTQLAELKNDLAIIQTHTSDEHHHTHGSPESEEDLKKLLSVSSVLAKGKEVFQTKCAVCHGNELQGNIGPNLVDDYWIHGKGTLSDILGVVRIGVADKGMPTWGNVLSDEEIKATIAYIGVHHGTHPLNPKAPQGEKIVSP